ncbi:hypothetical protein D047_1937, partial [Vibrio parahaemolyticus VPTS-2010_2]
MRRGLVSNYIW